jgi:hypothetical protein
MVPNTVNSVNRSISFHLSLTRVVLPLGSPMPGLNAGYRRAEVPLPSPRFGNDLVTDYVPATIRKSR